MSFNNIMAFWGLIAIPIIILMYILKQSFETKKVSSTFLWELATKEDEVNTPWQKLKKNILMLLQIAVALLLVLALAKPMITQNVMTNKPEILVIDNSASMNAEYDSKMTRLEKGKLLAKEHVDELAKGSSVTIVSMGNETTVVLADETDKDKLKKSIDNIKNTYGSLKIDENKEFLISIANTYDAEEIVCFTDSIIESGLFNTVLVNSAGINVSLDYVNAFKQEDGNYEVMAKITNRYDEDTSINLQVFDEQDNLLSVSEVDLKARESKSISMSDIKGVGSYIYGEIKESDLINKDNKAYALLNNSETKKLLLISEGNIFLEKAILAVGRYDLYKANSADDVSEGFDMYIYDGIAPSKLTEEGALMFINTPSVDGYFALDREEQSGYSNFSDSIVTRYVKDEEFGIMKYKAIDNDTLEPIASVGDDSVIGIGNTGGRKYSVVSFDLHDSDFPLSMSFPVVVDRLLGYMLGDVSQIPNQYYAGQELSFEPFSTTQNAKIINPKGVSYDLKLMYPMTYYRHTEELGIYELEQIDSNQDKRVDYIKVSYPSNRESDITKVDDKNIKAQDKKSVNRDVETDIGYIFIILLILISMYEWKKYVRG